MVIDFAMKISQILPIQLELKNGAQMMANFIEKTVQQSYGEVERNVGIKTE